MSRCRDCEIRKIKMPENKVSWSKHEINITWKKTFKNSFVKNQCYKNVFSMFCPTETFLELRSLNDDIFEPFFWFFDTFVNQWCVKNDKNIFKLAFRLFLPPKFLKFWELTHIKKSVFNTTAKLKCRKS